MTEELEKEAEEYARNQWEGNLPWSVIQKSYYDGALPREKRIEELEEENEQIKNSDTLCKLIGEQKRKITELEAQIERMKNWCNCKNYQQCLIELAEQGKGMNPSECCVNCRKWELKEK